MYSITKLTNEYSHIKNTFLF